MESMNPVFPGDSSSAGTCAVMEADALERVNLRCSGGKLSGNFDSAPLGIQPISNGEMTGVNTFVCGDQCARPVAEDGCLCLEEVATGLRNPIFGTFAKSNSNLLYIAEQIGVIRAYSFPGFTLQGSPFLDIRGRVDATGQFGENGLLGFAFHPDFETNRRFYVFYTANPTTTRYTLRLSEFTAMGPDNAPIGDPASENILIQLDKPGAIPNGFDINNGGLVFFGVDGMLYLSIGDGGFDLDGDGPVDPFNNGQNLATLFGTVIRVDVSEPFSPGQPYAIPSDNPFVGRAGVREEIYSYGLKNAFRCTVDRGDTRLPNVFAHGKDRGRIFCGDVGQDSFEEIDILQSGGNFGWDPKEGFSCFDLPECLALRNPQTSTSWAVSSEGDILPIHTYPNGGTGQAVAGGYVYRGCNNPAFRGLYIFGDSIQRNLFRLKEISDGEFEQREIELCSRDVCTNAGLTNALQATILSFAEDYNGELYLFTDTDVGTVTSATGTAFRLVDPQRKPDPTPAVCHQPSLPPTHQPHQPEEPQNSEEASESTSSPEDGPNPPDGGPEAESYCNAPSAGSYLPPADQLYSGTPAPVNALTPAEPIDGGMFGSIYGWVPGD